MRLDSSAASSRILPPEKRDLYEARFKFGGTMPNRWELDIPIADCCRVRRRVADVDGRDQGGKERSQVGSWTSIPGRRVR